MKKNATNKLNNKGFSLVELIIVIAIMAVLVGVLAPQYIKYVERSRRSSDAANVDEIASSMQVLAADVSGTLDSANTGKYTATKAADKDYIELSSELAGVIDEYNISFTDNRYSFKSEVFKKATFTLTLTYTNNEWKYSVTGTVPSAD